MNNSNKIPYGLRSSEKQSVKENINKNNKIIYKLNDNNNEDDKYSNYNLESEKI
jgi:hypothetical protein